MKYGIIAFDIGRVFPRDVSSHLQQFYKYLANKIKNGTELGRTNEKTIPIPWNIVSSPESPINTEFLDSHIDNVYDNDLLILDVAHSQDTGMLLQAVRTQKHYIDHVIFEFFKRSDSTNPPLVVVLSGSKLDFILHSDFSTNYFRNGRIVNIDIFGNVFGNSRYSISGEVKDLPQLGESIIPVEFMNNWLPMDILSDRISKKIIKYPGYYWLTDCDGKKDLKSNYYDGQNCCDEIARFICLQLASLFNDGETVHLHYCVENSEWFENYVISMLKIRIKNFFGDDNNIFINNVSELSNEKSTSQSGNNVENQVFLTSFIASGRTVSYHVKNIYDKFAAKKVNVICALQSSNFDQNVIKAPDGVSIDINSMHILEGNRNPRPIADKLINNGYSGNMKKISKSRMSIPGDLFWLMSLESGVRPERHTPNYRSPISYITNYVRAIDKYSCYIAHLISNIVTRVASAPVLICIDEKNHDEPEADASIAICNSFKSLRGDGYICIKRLALDKLDQGSSKSDLEKEFINQEWLKQIVQVAKVNATAVIFDEFRYSGKTIILAIKLLSMFDIEVSCSITVVDFAPSSIEGEYSLYDLNLITDKI